MTAHLKVDVGHCWRTGGRAIREAEERLFCVHNHRDEDEHLVPGEGTIDRTKVVQALRRSGPQKGCFRLK